MTHMHSNSHTRENMECLCSFGIDRSRAIQLLQWSDDNLERAINAHFDGLMSTDTRVSPANFTDKLACAIDASTIDDASDPSLPTTQLVHPDLKNGDCVFFTLWKILEMLGVRAPCKTKALNAAMVRNTLFHYMEQHWFQTTPNGIAWHDVVSLAHNTGIPHHEQTEYGIWSTDPTDRLIAWKNERDSLFGGESELLAFVLYMGEHGVKIKLRVWRPTELGLVLVNTVGSVSGSIYADLLHTGVLDTNKAHMQLLAHGKFAFAPSKKRMRREDDPDYEQLKKK